MPLISIPKLITPELLFVIAKMGHGDELVIADSNFPSDSVAANCTGMREPLRVIGTTSDILNALLVLFPLDQYVSFSAIMMERVESDKQRGLVVPAYDEIAKVIQTSSSSSSHPTPRIELIDRYQFYDRAKRAFAIVQSTDLGLYANVIISKGVISE